MHFDRVEWVRVPAPTTAKRSRRPADDEGYDPSKSIHFMEINEKSWISMISQGFLGSLGNISSTTPSYAQASCATFEVPAQARGRRGARLPAHAGGRCAVHGSVVLGDSAADRTVRRFFPPQHPEAKSKPSMRHGCSEVEVSIWIVLSVCPFLFGYHGSWRCF